jgi:hypothetical protein
MTNVQKGGTAVVAMERSLRGAHHRKRQENSSKYYRAFVACDGLAISRHYVPVLSPRQKVRRGYDWAGSSVAARLSDLAMSTSASALLSEASCTVRAIAAGRFFK